MPDVFRELAPQDLHPHLRYIADGRLRSNRAEVLLGEHPVVIPALRFTYQRMPNRLGLLLRSSSLGRDALERALDVLQSAGHSLKVRRSAKLRLLSQCMPYWSASDPMCTVHAVAVLSSVCKILGLAWPPSIAVAYMTKELDMTLPGTLDRGSAWSIGFTVGRAVGGLLGGG